MPTYGHSCTFSFTVIYLGLQLYIYGSHILWKVNYKNLKYNVHSLVPPHKLYVLKASNLCLSKGCRPVSEALAERGARGHGAGIRNSAGTKVVPGLVPGEMCVCNSHQPSSWDPL